MKIPGGQLTLCFLMLGGLCATLLGGCAHLSGETPQFVRNGVEYGTTPGTFRGRWWNYYTRGASLLDGGFYAEAERDFRTALITRKKDQLWPRTYGLHFLSDYFPHRELGIAAYYQGNLDTADTELQLSLGQQHSARAAYFLDQIRRQKIAAAGGDHTPPAFEVLSGLEGIAALEFDLAGRASDDHYVSQVFVND
ncbi:MAG: hypothetical protein HYZ00_07600, partial [Candidatus Hydrogenedentes bacterium]|nr:hypothetical protein [Candidatus Hydrogenedentota bacterium]